MKLREIKIIITKPDYNNIDDDSQSTKPTSATKLLGKD